MTPRIHTSLLLCFVSALLFAGNSTYDTTKGIVFPAPSSAIFMEYGAETPSMATGATSINIPLFSLQCHEVTIPFALKYHTSGIKVFDDPNPCGYGWTLTPGLRIVRIVLGRPDELFEYVGDNPQILSDYIMQQRSAVTCGNLSTADANRYDTQRDIFTVCLPDGNHTFIYDRSTSSFISTKSGEIKVTADNGFKHFAVTDSRGTIYHFGESIEMTDFKYTTAWMLSDIVLTNGEKIYFSWEPRKHSRNISILTGDFFYDNFSTTPPSGIDAGVPVTHDGSRTQLRPYNEFQQLKSVSFPGGTVSLEYGGEYGSMLSRFVVKSPTETVKTATLTYADNFLLSDISLSDEGTYRFDYNPQRFIGELPDYWGYYNGKHHDGEPSLSPKMRIPCHDTGQKVEIGHADRSVDGKMMKANILTAVHYPTGGVSTFDYEPHQFNDQSSAEQITEGGGLRIVKITDNPADGGDTLIRTYKYGANENGLAQCQSIPHPSTFVSRHNTIGIDLNAEGYPKPTFYYQIVSVNNFSNCFDCSIGETPIWYDTVTEYTSSSAGENFGKTVYEFTDPIGNNVTTCDKYGNRLYIDLRRAFASGPLLSAKTDYKFADGKYERISKSKSTYRLTSAMGDYKSSQIVRNVWSSFSNYEAPDFDENRCALIKVTVSSPTETQREQAIYTNNIYTVKQYSVSPLSEQLQSTTETFYEGADSVQSATSYTYLKGTSIVASTSSTDYRDKREELRFTYPQQAMADSALAVNNDAQRQVWQAMTDANILSAPVATTAIKGGKVVTVQNIFSKYGDALYLPTESIIIRGGTTKSLGKREYDAYGNLVGTTSSEGVSNTYLWGYNGMYPIVQVKGKQYNEIRKILKTDTYGYPYDGRSGNPSALRKSLAPSYPVSTFDYKPLVGISQSTGNNGLCRQYAYDLRNRLAQIAEPDIGTTDQFAYSQHGEPLSASLTPSVKNLTVGDFANVCCSVENSSGNYSLQWTASDKNGKAVGVSNNGNYISMQPLTPGKIDVKCAVNDNLKHTSATAATSIEVCPETISLSDISGNDTPYATATLLCHNPVVIQFKAIVSLAEGEASLKIDNQDIALQNGDFSFDHSFSAGTHALQLSIADGKGEIIIYPIKVSGSHGELLGSGTVNVAN